LQHDRGSLFPWLSSRVSAFASLCGAPAHFTPVLFGGLLGSLFSALQFVASPVVGALSDVYGRRPVLLLTTAGVAASYAVWAVAAWTGLFSVFVMAR
jgi:MFS family permease